MANDCPVIASRVGGTPEVVKNNKNGLLFEYNNIDAYSFISYGIYENLKNKIPNKDKVFIPNPIDFNEIDSLKKEPLEDKYKHIFQKKVFINIGRLTEQKGQWVLIEAFSKLKDKDSNLVILGIGEKEQELKKLASEFGVKDRVFFLGFQKNPFKFLYNANIFVLSSLWEGFGNVIVEAMRCELAVISTNCPSGPKEILKDQEVDYGVLTPVNDVDALSNSMDLLLKDTVLLKEYKQKSIKRAKDYSSKVVVDKFEKEILKG